MGATGATHQRAPDLMGRRFTDLVVVSRADNLRDGTTAWILRCSRGHDVCISGIRLRSNVKHSRPTLCAVCHGRPETSPRSGSAFTRGRAPKTCSICHVSTHNRQNCPKRKQTEGRFCSDCYDQPWRRPRGIRVLCICGEAWAPEPRVTIDEVFEMPNYSKREVI